MSMSMQRLKRELAAPKKLMALGALVAVALLMWGRLLLKEVPQTATASPAGKIAASGDLLADLPVGALDLPVVRVDLAQDVNRDLFTFDRTGYVVVEKESFPVQRKLAVEQTDEQLRSAAVRRAAEALKLQSVVTGDVPRAVINGQLVLPGQEIEGFTLVGVAERHVLLERHNVIVRLKM